VPWAIARAMSPLSWGQKRKRLKPEAVTNST